MAAWQRLGLLHPLLLLVALSQGQLSNGVRTWRPVKGSPRPPSPSPPFPSRPPQPSVPRHSPDLPHPPPATPKQPSPPVPPTPPAPPPPQYPLFPPLPPTPATQALPLYKPEPSPACPPPTPSALLSRPQPSSNVATAQAPPPPEISAKPPETLDLTGVAYDSYLHGCTVYLDVDGSQSFAPDSDPHTTALNGIWDLSVPASLDLSAASIQVAADEQCTCETFNTTLLLPLAAPLGSSVVAALPTLLYHILRVPAAPANLASAEAVLKSGLGISLPPGPSLTSLDAISLSSVFPSSATWQQLLRAEVHVSNAVLQLATLMSLNTSSVPAAARFVFAAMAQAVINAASSNSTLDFTNTGTLATILNTAASSAQAQAQAQASGSASPSANTGPLPKVRPNAESFATSQASAFVPNTGVVGSGQLLTTSAAAVANIHRVIDTAGNLTAIFKASYIGHTLLASQLGQLATYANAASQLGYSLGNFTLDKNGTRNAPIQAQLDPSLLRAFTAATEYSVLLQAAQTAVLPGPIIPSLTPAAPSTPAKLPPPPPSRPPSPPRGTGDTTGSPPDEDNGSWAQTHPYILAGIIVGGCTAVAALLIVLCEYLKYRKHKREKDLGQTPWRQQPDPGAAPPPPGHQEQMRMASTSFAFSQAGTVGDAQVYMEPHDQLGPGKEPVFKQRRSTGMKWISNDIFGRSRGNSEAAEAGAASGRDRDRGDTASVSASLDRMGHLGQGGPVSRNIWQAMVRSVLQPVYFTRGPEAGADSGVGPEHRGSTGAVGDPMARSGSVRAAGPDMPPLGQQLRATEASMSSSFPPQLDRPGSLAPQPSSPAGPQLGPPSSFTPQMGPSPSLAYQNPAQSRRQRY